MIKYYWMMIMNKLYDYYLKSLGTIPSFLNKYLTVPSIIRLKDVSYFCGMDFASKDIYDFKEYITRYDHSLSVALLTWKYSKDKIATIAALFHDVATPCFSHVIDYMNKDYAHQESTEEYTEKIINSDELLKQYLNEDNINIEDIVNFKKYSIVDNNRPKLCADRLDGIILTSIAWTKMIDEKDIDLLLNDLIVYKNEDNEEELGFKTKEIALKAVSLSRKIDEYCHSNEDNYMMEHLALITKKAINEELISYEDLYTLNEKELFRILENSHEEELNELLKKFKTIKLHEIPNIQINGIKIRDLNPLVLGKRLL